MGKAFEQQNLPPSGVRRKTFKHDNTFAPASAYSVGASPRISRKHQQFDDYEHKYSINKNFPGTSDGPHIKGVHSYIFSDNNKKDYIHDNYGSFLSHKSAGKKSFLDYDDYDDLDFDLGLSKPRGGYGSRSSGYESKVSSRNLVYESPLPKTPISATSISESSAGRSYAVPPSSPTLPRRSAPVSSSPSYYTRKSPSPVRRTTQVSSTSHTAYRSQSPVTPSSSLHRRSPSPVLTSGLYRRSPSPSPVRRSFVSQVSAAEIPQRRASVSYTPIRRNSFAYASPSPTPQRRAYPTGTSLKRSPGGLVSTFSSLAAKILSPSIPVPPPPPPIRASTANRRHSIAATSASTTPLRRVPHLVAPRSTTATTIKTTETFTKHAPVYARRFPDRHTLVTTTLRPVYREVETSVPIDFEDTEPSLTPRRFIPGNWQRRHSLDAGLARMRSLGALDVYRERDVVTTRKAFRSLSRPPTPQRRTAPLAPLEPPVPPMPLPRFGPIHPPITRPEYVEKEPLYDVDMYWITRQELLEQPDMTSEFAPLKNRLRQIGSHTAPHKVLMSPVSRPGEIPHFTSNFVPYDPLYRAPPKVRPGGPLYVHSVGEDPRLLSQSELEPYHKDGVVCVMVVRGHTGGGGGTHSYHHVSSRVTGGSGGGRDYDLPLSAHSLGSSSLAGGAGYGGVGAGAGLGGAGLGRAGAGHHHTPSYHRLPMNIYERCPPHHYEHYKDELFPPKLEFLDLAEPDLTPHVRPYVSLGGHGGHVRPGSAGGTAGRRPLHGAGAGAGPGAGGYVPYVPSHTAGHHVPVHAAPYHSAPPYTPGSYGGGGGGGGGHPYHRSPVNLGDDTHLSPHRGRLPRETRASSMPVGAEVPPLEHFKGTPRSWQPAKPREVPAGNFTASRPPRHVEPPLSDVRRRARDVICKTRNDPRYYDY